MVVFAITSKQVCLFCKELPFIVVLNCYVSACPRSTCTLFVLPEHRNVMMSNSSDVNAEGRGNNYWLAALVCEVCDLFKGGVTLVSNTCMCSAGTIQEIKEIQYVDYQTLAHLSYPTVIISAGPLCTPQESNVFQVSRYQFVPLMLHSSCIRLA